MNYLFLLVGGTLSMAGFVAQPQQGEAEKLFEAMHKKIISARSVQVAVEMKGKTPDFDENTAIRVALWMKGTDKVRCELRISRKDGQDRSALFVSDGTAVVMRAGDTRAALPVPQNLVATFKSSLVTPGVDMVLGVLISDPLALKKSLVNSAFTLGAREKVGAREAQVVHYVANARDGKPGDAVKIALWIDTESNLPVKRVCVSQSGIRSEEVYRDWQLDRKIEPRHFELPK
jgi:outer membrane lipoprotein-sorting protein